MFNLNKRLVKELPDGLALVQRGLYYGDSLFETIRVFEGRIPLMPMHGARLFRGLQVMGYHIPADWSAGFFESEILRIAPENARIRLTIWRSPGGWYAPENDVPHFLLSAEELNTGGYEWFSEGIQLGLCESVRLPVDAFSGLKTLNAPRYVAAAREARLKGWDDAILLNSRDHICEATSSNLFWVTGDALFTPPLTDGCVTGVMRELLLALTKAAGYEVIEKSATFADLSTAEEVFLTNAVRGVRWVRNCEGKEFKNTKTAAIYDLLVHWIIEKLH